MRERPPSDAAKWAPDICQIIETHTNAADTDRKRRERAPLHARDSVSRDSIRRDSIHGDSEQGQETNNDDDDELRFDCDLVYRNQNSNSSCMALALCPNTLWLWRKSFSPAANNSICHLDSETEVVGSLATWRPLVGLGVFEYGGGEGDGKSMKMQMYLCNNAKDDPR